jgi:hypothetical protein
VDKQKLGNQEAILEAIRKHYQEQITREMELVVESRRELEK